jgi:hypothetical protein
MYIACHQNNSILIKYNGIMMKKNYIFKIYITIWVCICTYVFLKLHDVVERVIKFLEEFYRFFVRIILFLASAVFETFVLNF